MKMSRWTLLLLLACLPAAFPLQGLYAQSTQAEKTKDPAKLRKQADKLQHQIELARLELESNTISVTLRRRKAQAAVRDARFNLKMAKQALDAFRTAEVPTKLKDAQISLDQARNRAELAEAELNELIAMYKEDEFAEMTKELVLKRGRKNLEFARRRLAVQKDKMEQLKKQELPRREAQLANKLLQSQDALADAELGQKKADIEVRIMTMKATRKLADLENELKEVKNRLGTLGANAQ